ncbi:MAG: response regulator [candidate division Zixibacteria bacterium]|nr:response regulator [candidate division Zixibacteria bacterium]
MKERVILLVDDSPSVLNALKRTFRLTGGYRSITAESAREALDILQEESIDVLITDENMPEMAGTELLRIVRVMYPSVIKMMLTGRTDVEVAKDAINSGQIYRFFNKPWDDYELLLSVRQALQQKQLEEENARLRATVERQQEVLKGLEERNQGITGRESAESGVAMEDGKA